MGRLFAVSGCDPNLRRFRKVIHQLNDLQGRTKFVEFTEYEISTFTNGEAWSNCDTKDRGWGSGQEEFFISRFRVRLSNGAVVWTRTHAHGNRHRNTNSTMSIRSRITHGRLCLVFALSIFLGAALVSHADQVGDFTYRLINEDREIEITGYSGPGGELSVPDLIANLPVTRIGFAAFSDQTTITSVAVPDSIIVIERNAFSDCTALTNVTLGSGVTNIGDFAFLNCGSLTTFSVSPANVTFSGLDGVLFSQDRTVLIQHPLPGPVAGNTTGLGRSGAASRHA